MTDPKLLRIVKEVQRRLEAINGVDPYYTNIGQFVTRDRRQVNDDEVPCITLTLNPMALDQSVENRLAVDATILVECFSKRNQTTTGEDLAIYMMADVQTALEIAPRDFDGDLLKQLNWSAQTVFYPENAGHLVGAQVEYSIPHVRRYGDPVN